MIHFNRWFFITVWLLVAGVCFSFAQEKEKKVELLDPSHPKAVAGQKGWEYQKTSSVDLDGDNIQEQVFLTANVSLNKGEPLWDDGQIWQVYIQSSDGQRTYVYSKFVQLGQVEVLTTSKETKRGETILILERTPHAFSVYEVHYCGNGKFQAVQVMSREIDPRLTPTSLPNKKFKPSI